MKMHCDPPSAEVLQLQYELSLAIGIGLDMAEMVQTALRTFVRKLNCAAAVVALYDELGKSSTYAIPCVEDANRANQILHEHLTVHDTSLDSVVFAATLPIVVGDEQKLEQYCMLELPNVGVLVLVWRDEPSAMIILQAMRPLLTMLAGACQACRLNEELAAAHLSMSRELNILRTFVDNSPAFIFAIDSSGILTLIEGDGLNGLGMKVRGLQGKSIRDIFGTATPFIDGVERALRGEATSTLLELRGLAFDARLEPIMDDTGRVAGAIGVMHDVTELQVAQETLKGVLNTMGEVIVAADSSGLLIMANTEVKNIFGYEADEVVGKSLGVFFAGHDGDALISALQSYCETGESTLLGQRIELESVRINGEAFPVEVHMTETQIADQLIFTISIRDISERRELERMRDDFIANVSHELRTPLASVMGWTETLLGERPGPLSDRQQRFLSLSLKSSQRLSALVEEILTVSKIQRGSLRLLKRSTSPQSCINNVLEEVQALLAARSMSVIVDDQWPVHQQVVADPDRIEQVLGNLLSNAIKFSPDGTMINLRSRSDGGQWVIEVEDKGIGIPRADIPKLFQRFFRTNTSIQSGIQGTGLGLYICKALIDGHGGTIDVKSALGKGSCLRVAIPTGMPQLPSSGNTFPVAGTSPDLPLAR